MLSKNRIHRRARPRAHVTAWSSSSAHVWEMVLADGDCSCTAITRRISICRNLGVTDFTSPAASKRAMFPEIKVYAKMWLPTSRCKWKPPYAIVSVWFDMCTFGPADILRSLPEGTCTTNKLTRIEHIKHSSRFFCGSYAHNTTSDMAFSTSTDPSKRKRQLADSGYRPAYCLRWHYNNCHDAVCFFDQLAGMMKRMESKRCPGCHLEVRWQVKDACYMCDSAAVKIQMAFRRAIADPGYGMCRRRLLREADEMSMELWSLK